MYIYYIYMYCIYTAESIGHCVVSVECREEVVPLSVPMHSNHPQPQSILEHSRVLPTLFSDYCYHDCGTSCAAEYCAALLMHMFTILLTHSLSISSSLPLFLPPRHPATNLCECCLHRGRRRVYRGHTDSPPLQTTESSYQLQTDLHTHTLI